MDRKTKALCLASGLLIAASVANAAKPSLTPQERKAKSDQIRKNHSNFNQPRTMVQAEATAVRQPDGTTGLTVPTELWNHLSVQRDASGQLQMRETEGDPAATDTRAEGSDHE